MITLVGGKEAAPPVEAVTPVVTAGVVVVVVCPPPLGADLPPVVEPGLTVPGTPDVTVTCTVNLT
jgi:hypothetical protein